MKEDNVGEGENASNQHYLPFLRCFFKDLFLTGMKNCDCIGKESNVEKKKKDVLVESHVKFLFFENIR